ncbi:ribosomal protein S5-alanine N-acetyltransferase [Vibrio maerlii]|uniref:ribosomal protein S5-alanine N-acetyltransferase n=1 Tax=Vibrio maerlii TaxID=2231648 RepID=UPI000E3C113A|nr:ribosomal protein S5-alanine N-acetyltransferase [Vibrio maerlii]
MQKRSSSLGVYERFDGLLLRCAEPQDAERISHYFQSNREYLQPWEPRREEAFYTQFGWSKKLIKLHELHKMGLAYYFLIIDEQTDTMLGTISFSNLTRFPFHACNVGYSLAKNTQGRGVMSRALQVACQYMFHYQNMHRITASYMPHNEKSAKVLKRVGFSIEGEAKDYLLIDGEWRDHVLTSLINLEWQANPNKH